MKIPQSFAWLLPRPPLTKLLTPRAQQALALSRRAAFENGGSAVDTDHLLAGLLRLNQGSLAYVLWASRIDLPELRASLDRPGATRATPAEAMRLPFLPSIKRTLAAAKWEAREMGDAHVGTEHLLLGLLANGQGPGANALVSKGLTLETARAVIRFIRDTPTDGQPAPILVLFDVDGTLTESFDLDSATYLDALREVFGFRDVSDDWAAYPHVTDGGILAEVFQTRLGRSSTPQETDAMRTHFAALLAARINAADGLRPVAGAAELLARLAERPDRYAVAYASGGWGVTARLKLQAAGLPTGGMPGAFADDDPTREGICRAAHRRAEERHGRELPSTVYIGDGVWDVRTSRRLGYGFIGIGRDAAKLRAEGAAETFPNFRDPDAFLTGLLRSAGTMARAR